MPRLLIIDNSNIFIRSWVVNPHLSSNGIPVGGLVGSLQSLQKFLEDTKPDYIIIAWDGAGGSARRRQYNKEYKNNRKPIKLNWNMQLDGGEREQVENKVFQLTKLYDLYNCLPLTQIMIDGVEADDIIAYVSQMSHFKNWQKVIVSSDKDFIQLLDNKTVLYRPTQKQIMNVKTVVKDYHIHPNNFLLARSICGDKSDNLKGVDGAGIATIAKRFPEFLEEKQLLIPDIEKKCMEHIHNNSKIKLFKNILNQIENIQQNYNMMQLVIPKIPVNDAFKLQEKVKNYGLITKKTEFLRILNNIGAMHGNYEEMFQHCNRIQKNLQLLKNNL